MDSQDKRYQRTHARIRQVFEELVQTESFRDITVSSVSRRAGINRKTFYMHYESTTQLLNEMVEEIVREVQACEAEYRGTDGFCGAGMMEGFFRVLARREALHRRLICSPEYLFAFQMVTDSLARQSSRTDAAPLQLDSFRQRVVTTFLTGSVMQIYRDWLISGKPISEQELARFLERLMQGCLQGISEGQNCPKL